MGRRHGDELVQAKDALRGRLAAGAAGGERLQDRYIIDAGIEKDVLDPVGIHHIDDGFNVAVIFHFSLTSYIYFAVAVSPSNNIWFLTRSVVKYGSPSFISLSHS